MNPNTSQSAPFSGPTGGSTSDNVVTTPVPTPPLAANSPIVVPSVGSQMPNTAPPVGQSSQLKLASGGSRFLAQLIDGIILGVLSAVISIPLGMIVGTMGTNSQPSGAAGGVSLVGQLIIWLIYAAYPIYFIGKSGQTPGKSIMKIKVVRINSTEEVGFVGAFLRELVGKTVSSIVFALGYLSILWDKNKQGWHDKIAGTIVVKLS